MSKSKTLFGSSAFAPAIGGLHMNPLGTNLGTVLSSVDKISTATDQAVAVLMTQTAAKSFVPVEERKTLIAGMEHMKTLIRDAGLSGSVEAVSAINEAITTVQAQPRTAPVPPNGHGTEPTHRAGDRRPGEHAAGH